jgi:hypothetical protein
MNIWQCCRGWSLFYFLRLLFLLLLQSKVSEIQTAVAFDVLDPNVGIGKFHTYVVCVCVCVCVCVVMTAHYNNEPHFQEEVRAFDSHKIIL